MNIAFDAVAILGPGSKNRGIGNYSLAQFREMLSQDQDNSYFFFNVFEPYSLGDFPRLTDCYFDCGQDREILWADNSAVYGDLVQRFIKQNKIDVFYITSPFDGTVPVYQKNWFKGVKTVATVYDIIPYLYQDRYFHNKEQTEWYFRSISVLRWVDELFVISQSVKDDLMKYLDFSGENIHVIWGAASSMFREIKVSEEERQRLTGKFSLADRFIMCTGGDDERKNIGGLIEAYGRLPKELTDEFGLAIVCKLKAESVERYQALARKYGVENRVALTNFVSDEELLSLYNMCSLVAFPSKYEGLGLPVIEGWACGKPVLTGNNSSLSQIAGDAATLVDAEDIDDISRGLAEALSEDRLAEMAQRGQERLKLFQWSEVAKAAIEQINCLEKAEIEQKKHPRLAVFTPLPPQKSGIAECSLNLVEALADLFDIDVFIDDGYEPNCTLPKNVSVMNHTAFSQKSNNYEYILFQMENSMPASYMVPYLKKHGGTLALHDLNLFKVALNVGMAQLKDGIQASQNYLLADLGEKRTEVSFEQGKIPLQEDASSAFVTDYADRIIVQSRCAWETLLKKNIKRTVRFIPPYVKIEPLGETDRARKKLGISPDVTVLSAFGSVCETKRSLPLLKAAIRFLEEYEDAAFCFVGEQTMSEEKAAFEETLNKCKVSDRIAVTGYISAEDFSNYISATDICFNLRYPYNGESSGSLARVLAQGKCAVVNDIGSFSEVPDDCCVKLPSAETMEPEEEIQRIYDVMVELYLNTENRQLIGKRARDYAVKELDIQRVAKQYEEFLLNDQKNRIGEHTLEDIKEAMRARAYPDEKVRSIAKTLAYCIEA